MSAGSFGPRRCARAVAYSLNDVSDGSDTRTSIKLGVADERLLLVERHFPRNPDSSGGSKRIIGARKIEISLVALRDIDVAHGL